MKSKRPKKSKYILNDNSKLLTLDRGQNKLIDEGSFEFTFGIDKLPYTTDKFYFGCSAWWVC